MHLVITGFNGNYTGYVVWVEHYDQYKKEEVRTTSWMGPYSGKFYSDINQKVISEVKDTDCDQTQFA